MTAPGLYDTLDPLDSLAKRYENPLVEQDPVVWSKDNLSLDLYSKQRSIMRLIEIVPKLCVPSCHSAGKSLVSAAIAVRFLARYPPGTARVVTTAPTMTQVRAILWNEINQLHVRAAGAVPGRVNQTELWIGGYMAGIGRKPSDYAPETFQGLHAEHLLVIIDEAGAVPNDLWTGVDTLATNVGSHILAIGNPDDPQTEFKTVCDGAERGDNGWAIIRIPAWETPNMSGEVVTPLIARALLSKDWVEDKRSKWGEDSALWASKVAAEFPDESSMTVVRVADVTAALQGFDMEDNVTKLHTGFEDVQLGVDIAASEQGDETVIRERRGNRILRRWSVRSGEPEDVSDLIVQAQAESGATLIHVDATGVGFGFLADVRRRLPNVAVMGFVAAGQAKERKEFENRRAEAHWVTREKLRKRELDMSQMEDSDGTLSELMSVRYRIKKGRIIVELKDDVRKRIGRSPDDSDALLLAVLPPMGVGVPVSAVVHASSRERTEAIAHDRQRAIRAANQVADAALLPSTPRAVPERVFATSGRGIGRKRRPRVIRAR